MSYTCSGCGRERRAKPYEWAADHLYCKLCVSDREEVKTAYPILTRNEKAEADRYLVLPARGVRRNHLDIVEKLNTPTAVVLVLAFFLIVDSFLFYRYQQNLPTAVNYAAAQSTTLVEPFTIKGMPLQ